MSGNLSCYNDNGMIEQAEKSGSYSVLPPLSPISEYVANEDSTVEESQEEVSRLQGSSSGTNTRSVSAAVSDESVAGDSGVFEASNNRKSDNAVLCDYNADTAQIQVKLRFVALAKLTFFCFDYQ